MIKEGDLSDGAGGASGLGELFACVGISAVSGCVLNFGETEFQFDLCRWEHLLLPNTCPAFRTLVLPGRTRAPPSVQLPPPQGQRPTESETDSDGDALRAVSEAARRMDEGGALVWLPGRTSVRRRGRLGWLLNCVGAPQPLVGRNGAVA